MVFGTRCIRRVRYGFVRVVVFESCGVFCFLFNGFGSFGKGSDRLRGVNSLFRLRYGSRRFFGGIEGRLFFVG